MKNPSPCLQMAYIQHPPKDVHGQARPPGMWPIHLGSQHMRRIVSSLHKRRETDPKARRAVDSMERYLWREANSALGYREHGLPTVEQWQELLAEAPPTESEAPGRAALRRKALVWRGLSKSLGTKRPLASDAPQSPIRFRGKRWQSPVPRSAGRKPMFSEWRLDYYWNRDVPAEPRDWIEDALAQRLVQRGRARPRQSPRAARRSPRR